MRDTNSNVHENLITVSGVARELGVSEQTVRNYQDRGILPGFRLASGIRVFQISDVEALKAKRGSRHE
jgi:DNA-binding transcriptional MerR regulator